MDTESAAQRISDFLVIGAGSAGCVLARRLLDAGHTVTLVEAGEQDVSPDIDDVSRLGLLWGSPVDWNYFTEPQPGLDGRCIHLPRGKVLGGSHSLNAAIWVRGDRSDYDHWAEAGCPGWGWDDVVPFFEAIEAYPEGDPSTRGHDGPLPITTQYPHHPVQQAMYDAAVQEGIPENPDYNSGSVEGVGWMQLTVRDDKRVSSWRAYMKPTLDHPGLTLITGGHVRRLLVDGTTVTGAEVTVDGQRLECRADEVVLCGGTFGSAELLLRSGIGPAEDLRELGIDVVRDAPGVGRNLHDHLLTPVICITQETMPAPEVAAAQVHYWAASDPSLPVPDTQPIFFSVPMYTSTAGDPMVGPEDGFSLLAGIVRPSSRGRLTLSGPDPEDPVRIDLGAMTEEDDVRSMLFSLRQCRSIAAQPALAELGAQEIFPGPEVGDGDEELTAYIRSTTTTYHHPVGTCAMGPDDGAAVVDPETFRVHGVQGLRVADASIMPRVTTGNTNAPSVLIGEKAAAAITGVTPF
ncbi:GMC family oxidoreductase [Kocuria palustris]|uniref:GMC family oxidoreductase n=1 Tax=Kocuria palustris TaxID=71999 RepID=UPI002043D8F6|nr:GMC family oxidoreductase N-terminal domain-containing protein [Kocuria palustris]MCM3330853.1 GMC family oxidoreductase N-terminal domain-containing protein [Kocuria palustris]